MKRVDCGNEGTCEVSNRDLDVIFDILSASRRRFVLQYLFDCQGNWADMEEVVDYVADRADLAEGSNESVAVDLRHNHFPRMEQAGIVEFDARSESVRYHPDALLETWLVRALEEVSQ